MFSLETLKNPSLLFDERVPLSDDLSLGLDRDPSGMLNPISGRR